MDPEDGEDFDDLDETFEEPEQPEDESPEEPEQEEPEEEDEPEPERKPSRAQARIEALDREVREARERAEAAERRLNEVSNGRSRTDQAETARQREERLRQMDPWDREQFLRRESEERTTNEIRGLQAQIADSSDRAEFASACATNPALAKVKDKVETELQKLRANGQTVPRSTLAAYLIGQSVLEKAPKARERAAKRAAGNLDRERARPAGGASDAPRGREKDEKAARDKRLEDYTF